MSKNIHKKLFEVMRDLGSIKKSGYNSHQKYHYPTEQDILEAVKPQLIEKGVSHYYVVLDYTLSDNNQFATVITENIFTDIESGEEIRVRAVGTGMDKQDKAIYKAETGANKYALSKTFMIATDDDPENDNKTTTNSTNKTKPAPKPAPMRPPGKAAPKPTPKPTSSFSGGGFAGGGATAPKPKIEPRTNPFAGGTTPTPKKTEIEIPDNIEEGPF